MSEPVPDDLLSIGDVADATGISVGTLRVWERRYQRPKPVRLSSRHRRYTNDHVRWLRRVAEALSRGHRPSKVVPLADADLDLLLAPTGPDTTDSDVMNRLLDLVFEFKEVEIRQLLHKELGRLGPGPFLAQRISPLITKVGRLWADGDLQIRHEHFLSELLEDYLRSERLDLKRDDGPTILLATLSGETHGLGLQMIALTAAAAGARPLVLGTDVPNEEIVIAARETKVGAVCVSVSLATGGVATDRVLADLRRRLPSDVRLVIGGRGARGVRRGPRDVDYVNDLSDFEQWLESAGLTS